MTTRSIPTLVLDFFAAMQGGAASESAMMALFRDDAAYIEPFSGSVRRHQGKAAIREVMLAGWQYPLPDMRIVVDAYHATSDGAVADWTCHSPGLPAGKGSGCSRFTFSGGLIASLETTVR